MLKKRTTNPKGFMFVELIIATVVAAIVLLGIGAVVADSQRGWNKMYNRIYSDVVTDGLIARRTFDRIIRQSSRNNILLDDMGSWVEVRYYQDSDSTVLDRYARFYVAGSELKVEYGNLDPGEVLSTQTVCSNVSSCGFRTAGTSVQMVLRLDNGSEAATVMASAVAHN
jgi:hypothetical protein